MEKIDKFKISYYDDIDCEKDGKQSDKELWYKYYDTKTRSFVFGGARCFSCDNDLEKEIYEGCIYVYFSGEELEVLLKDREEELKEKWRKNQ